MSATEPNKSGPPSFEESRNRRQRARSAGMNPDYWYAVELDANIKPGEVKEVVFWKQSIALYRGLDGELHAVENRCAHRQLKLSTGGVKGCHLVCPYHGWEYDGEGRVTYIPHDLFGRNMPRFQIRSYPVKVRYELIWLFPGDPEMAEVNRIPDIPELEGKDRWPFVPLDYTWDGHHSMIIDNVSDFTHEYLHRKHRPFTGARLKTLDVDGDAVRLSYDATIGAGKLMQAFVDKRKVNQNKIDLCYQYPYQWSNTDDKIKHWLFLLPINERKSRAFFIFYFKQLKLPLLPIKMPRMLMESVIRVANRVIFDPLLGEDGWAVELEQDGYDRHYDAPLAEINPAVREFQDLTIRKWQEHLDKQAAKEASRGKKRSADDEAPACAMAS